MAGVEIATEGAVVSFVTEFEDEIPIFPATSGASAVNKCAPADRPIVLTVAEKLVPLQSPPVWDNPVVEPSTLITTVCEASLQDPEIGKDDELVDVLIYVEVAGASTVILGAAISFVTPIEPDDPRFPAASVSSAENEWAPEDNPIELIVAE